MIREGYQLYQMKKTPKCSAYIYQDYNTLTGMRYYPNASDYDMVYECPLPSADANDIGAAHTKLKIIQQNTGRFRAVSVSDVIAIYGSGITKCYFVESSDFTQLKNFFGNAASAGNHLAGHTKNYPINGQEGLWHVLEVLPYEHTKFYLMEHQEKKGQVPCIILDMDGGIVDDNCISYFDETAVEKIRRFLHPEIPKTPPAKHDCPPKEQQPRPEASREENDNHIVGIDNNRKRWIPPKKRKSVRKRLHEKQSLLHGKKVNTHVLEKR